MKKIRMRGQDDGNNTDRENIFVLWGDLFQIPLPGGGSVGISLLIILLIPTGIYFTIRTRFLPIRLFPEMVRSLNSKKGKRMGCLIFKL